MSDSASSTRSMARLAFLVAVFFGGMALMEVVLEAATRELSLDAYAVGLVVTCAQFIGCFFVAVLSGGSLTSGNVVDLHTFGQQWLPYLGLASLIFGGTGLANIAAGWVQYPVKVVFKSSKLIPTMLVSVVMRNSKPFSMSDYISALLLCAGTAGFSFRAGQSDSTAEAAALGIAMLVTAAFCDACSSNVQQRLMQQMGVSPMDMMLRLNLVGAIGSAMLLVSSGEAGGVVAYAREDHRLLTFAAGVGLTIGIGVWANTQLINEAGSVVAVGVATLRKVFTIVLSYVLFPKPLTMIHVIAGLLVTAGLALSSFRCNGSSGGQRKGDAKEEGETAPLVNKDAVAEKV